jgi:ABC-2 type transport system ATP-binding protein
LQRFVAAGGSVIFSSHVMALVERLCDHLAVLAAGKVVASGSLDEVRGAQSLEDAFVDIVGARTDGAEGLSWLAS